MNFCWLKEGQFQLRSDNFFVQLVPEVANGILRHAVGDKTRGNLIKALYNKIITITAPCRRRNPSQCCKFKLASSHRGVEPLTCLVRANKGAEFKWLNGWKGQIWLMWMFETDLIIDVLFWILLFFTIFMKKKYYYREKIIKIPLHLECEWWCHRVEHLGNV